MATTPSTFEAAGLLAELQARGVAVTVRGADGLRAAPADRLTPELRRRLVEAKPELLRLLAPPQALGDEARGDGRTSRSAAGRLSGDARTCRGAAGRLSGDGRTCRGAAGRLSGRRRVPEPDMTWPADLADWVLTLTGDDLPAVPFTLAPGRTVVDAARWLGRLQADIRRGPAGPRTRYGALQGDIRRLRASCGAG